MADHELISDDEREDFAGTSAVADEPTGAERRRARREPVLTTKDVGQATPGPHDES